jgi:hypothetical protein
VRAAGRRRSLPGVALADSNGPLDIDLLAASLRADTSDLRAFVEALAVKLENAVPGAVSVQRRREGMFGPKLVQRISLDAGDQRLELRAQGAGIATRCSRLSGGIVIKSDELGTDAWLEALGQALSVEAQRSQITRQALQRLLNE